MSKKSPQAAKLAIALVAASTLLGCSPREHMPKLADAIPVFLPHSCVPADSREREIFELAASAMEITRSDELNSLDMGAQQLLGGTLERGKVSDAVTVCPPDDVLMRVTNALSTRGGFGPGSLSEYRLRLAATLPRVDPWLIASVGNAAFGESIMPSALFRDQVIRPYARSVLAGFGTAANGFSQVAYEQMSGKDSLGTGAAQVAAATDHPNALPRIAAIMEELLSATPEDEAIPYHTVARLRELAFAIYFAGPRGKEYTAPIRRILRRKIESWAPPFGMLDIDPDYLCGLLASIEGDAATEPYKFCTGQKRPVIPRASQ